jgi:pimeloyl-ACP methyl ester carboxylesterase
MNGENGGQMQDGVVEAVVQAHGVETHYVRAGRGPAVLLLRAGGSGSTDPLFVHLATDFRVIAPVIPDVPSLAAWIRDVIDGLGLDRPSIVADAVLARRAVLVVLADEERARHVAVVGESELDAAGVERLVAYLRGEKELDAG